ncbi:MAG: recombinase RecT [Saprospiraceae bacterium]|nr:recombinase RecT [Saprospiraceae bacterium]
MDERKKRIDTIVTSILDLENDPAIEGFFGENAKMLVSGESAAVRGVLTRVPETTQAQTAQNNLIACTPESWQQAASMAILLGVSLNPFLKHAALIAYGTTVKLQIMVAGIKHVVLANGAALTITAQAVCRNDRFKMIQPLLPQTIASNFYFEKAMENRGEVIGGFAFYTLANGGFHGDYLPYCEIKKRRDVARTQAIWDKWENEMIEKTLIHYTQKDLPTFSKSTMLNEIENEHIDFQKLNAPTSALPATTEGQFELKAKIFEDVEAMLISYEQLLNASEFESDVDDCRDRLLKEPLWKFASSEQKAKIKAVAAPIIQRFKNAAQ